MECTKQVVILSILGELHFARRGCDMLPEAAHPSTLQFTAVVVLLGMIMGFREFYDVPRDTGAGEYVKVALPFIPGYCLQRNPLNTRRVTVSLHALLFEI
jgi:hypothetical protein